MTADALPKLACWTLHEHATLGSTNDEALRLASAGAPHGVLVTAAQQTAGRGRLGRNWSSPSGNLHASFLIRPGVPPNRAAELGFVAALAVLDTCDALSEQRASLKWPNDVLVGGAKLAGILTELAGGAVIVGIGLNVGSAPDGLPYATACLGPPVTVEAATQELAEAMQRRFRSWQSHGFGGVRENWMARGPAVGSVLALQIGITRSEGVYAGLDLNGALMLDGPQGRRRFVAGETTL